MALTGEQFTISAGEHEATIVEVAAGLRRYAHRGVDVTASYAEDEIAPRACGITLVPWPNRIRGGSYRFDGADHQLPHTEPARGNAIHGLARWVRWTPRAADASSVSLALDLVPQNGWPFEVRVGVVYALDAEHGLTVTISATNTGSARAPFGAGSHPYLSVHGHRLDDVSVLLPAGRHLELDAAGLPVGSHPVDGTGYDLRAGRRLDALRMDDGFTDLQTAGGRGAAEVRTPSGGARLWFDAAFTCLQVFTPDDWAHGIPAVAIEPMTCPADAFNSGDGLIVLDPGTQWSGAWGITPLSG